MPKINLSNLLICGLFVKLFCSEVVHKNLIAFGRKLAVLKKYQWYRDTCWIYLSLISVYHHSKSKYMCCWIRADEN